MFRKYLKSSRLKFAEQIKKEFPDSEIFLVGGSLRNILLGIPVKDYDFVIKNVPRDRLQKILKKIGKVNLVGKHFGVFKFRPLILKTSKMAIDIALPRSEVGWGTGFHKDFTVQSNPHLDISKDLKRRDFTMNAIAYDVFKNKIIDPFNGQKDIKRKIIRAVLDPQKRFKEDFSRIMRAIRFACVFNFNIEDKTWRAIKQLGIKLDYIAKETVALEFKKMLEVAPVKALHLLFESKILNVLIPEILKMKNCIQPENYHSEGDVWDHTLLGLSILEKKIKKRPLDIELVFSVLFHDIGKPVTRTVKQNKKISFKYHNIKGSEIFNKISKRLKLQSAGIDTKEINFLIRHHMIIFSGNPLKIKNITLEKYFLKNKKQGENLLKLIEIDALASIPSNGKQDFSTLNIIKKRIKEIKNLSQNKKQTPVSLLNGFEVMDILNLNQCPKVGYVLKKLREAQLSKKVNTKIEAKKWIENKFGVFSLPLILKGGFDTISID